MEYQGAMEYICALCGKRFIQRASCQNNGTILCPQCRNEIKIKKQQDSERRKKQLLEQQKQKEAQIFQEKLKNWPLVSLDKIKPEENKVLYIIGNGFDLMHGVQSSYYSFRDSLGKNNALRQMLESYLKNDDIWADFEAALAKINVPAMLNPYVVDSALDMYDAYDKNASSTDFLCAVDTAILPMSTITQDLPRRLRQWVDQLSVETDDRPLKGIFRQGKVLCFNYTEFIEALYGISNENVCYIHGCRRKKKGFPKEPLILGHQPDAHYALYNIATPHVQSKIDRSRKGMIYIAQESALDRIVGEDNLITKNSAEIIVDHKAFFKQLDKIEKVIVIGHSLSQVDWLYFKIIKEMLPSENHVHWYFGCYNLQNLDNLSVLTKYLSLPNKDFSIFRTDVIRVKLHHKANIKSNVNKKPSWVKCSVSADARWMVWKSGNQVRIDPINALGTGDSVLLFGIVRDAVFISEQSLLIAVEGLYKSILLFRFSDGNWHLLRELEPIPNQGLLNRRLKSIYLIEREIYFVYNNRVRTYGVCDGILHSNKAIRNAGNRMYSGKEIFFKSKKK